jgi:enoyl-[acyl-carrier protein] reductase III
MSFKDKIALVTGGSRGIGRAITMKLAGEGATVIINYFRNRKAAEQTMADVKNMGGNASIIRANVGDEEKINAMFDTITSDYGKLDIFINNAASGAARSALELDSQAWDWTMDINAKAFLLCAQRAAKLMEDRKGKMVAISSLGSFMVWSSYTVVGVSKAALEAMTRYLAIEMAPLGISVNAISAGGILTEALKLYVDKLPDSTMYQNTPAGRALAVEDVANVVAFLCSDDAEMIRGQTIVIDGGLSIAPFHYLKTEKS